MTAQAAGSVSAAGSSAAAASVEAEATQAEPEVQHAPRHDAAPRNEPPLEPVHAAHAADDAAAAPAAANARAATAAAGAATAAVHIRLLPVGPGSNEFREGGLKPLCGSARLGLAMAAFLLPEGSPCSTTSPVTPPFLWRRLLLVPVLGRRRKGIKVLPLHQAPLADERRNEGKRGEFSLGGPVTPRFYGAP